MITLQSWEDTKGAALDGEHEDRLVRIGSQEFLDASFQILPVHVQLSILASPLEIANRPAWISSALNAGLFKLQADPSTRLGRPEYQKEENRPVACLCRSLFALAEKEGSDSPGRAGWPPQVMQAVGRLIDHLIAQLPRPQEQRCLLDGGEDLQTSVRGTSSPGRKLPKAKSTGSQVPDDPQTKTLALLLGSCVHAGEVDMVRQILRACPQAVHVPLRDPPRILDPRPMLTAVGLAVYCNRSEVLSAMKDEGVDILFNVALWPNDDMKVQMLDVHSKKARSNSRTVLAMMDRLFEASTDTHEVLAREVMEKLATPGSSIQDQFIGYLHHCLSDLGEPAVMLAKMGCFERFADETVQELVETLVSHPSTTPEHMARLSWMQSHLLDKVLPRIDMHQHMGEEFPPRLASPRGASDLTLAQRICERYIDMGFGDLLFASDASSDDKQVSAVQTWAKEGRACLVALAIEKAMMPDREGLLPVLVKVAEENGHPKTAAVVRSFMARREALGAVSDLRNEMFPSP